ncbi:TlyA family RNA methyltransferase [Thermoflexus sp.]|uniref:TlyA family RNA methyltransferase n=1 Tax=Thermoflexus sp. TaxID=1969742 RepID=UPI0025F48D3B|nr:TlyA family RNA methyltransferase [Thermoflexus sp.]MDW8179343.1 TlyA family RNA methyltransferase [Anaerolineae bacterium]MCS6964976.1 TlyA family RNA methyltransferase [Thermoflexus sp.]MCS7349897.1 TlyA family RNA methyltransferase [Thermoflexus sp.]MCX7690763.1 TlyA family RNA methyltransferase [Thermoflexus sp.]MDW8184606.1 TlyA family RNA methyltransferase [Anaerolineae bacterium]
MSRVRLDFLLVERGLAESRERAQRLIRAGRVRIGDQVVDKPGTLVPADAPITVTEPLPYVSRGGLKLAAALARFPLPVRGAVCADVGASTGGFTDCLLQHGAARVYAIDVGYGLLDLRLRQDPRVVVMERTNARYLSSLPEPIHLVTIDVSFISVRLILPNAYRWLVPEGHAIVLVKPQFEAGRSEVRRGVVRDRAVHERVLRTLIEGSISQGWRPRGLIPSPLLGPAGNIEFLLWLQKGEGPADLDTMIREAFAELEAHPPSREY